MSSDRFAVFLLGPSCSGKSTIIDQAKMENVARRIDGQKPLFGFVEVGKELRKRYSPDYFKGQGSPKHTEEEALTIFQEHMMAEEAASVPIVLIDGQPRNIDQLEDVYLYTVMTCGRLPLCLVCHATEEVLIERATHRDAGDLASLELAKTRIQGDGSYLYPVVMALSSQYEVSIVVLFSEKPSFVLEAMQAMYDFRESVIGAFSVPAAITTTTTTTT